MLLTRKLNELPHTATTRQRMITLLTRGHLTARNESWSRVGARLGIHYASPLQDRRIVDFALSLPPPFFTYRVFTDVSFAASLPATSQPKSSTCPNKRQQIPDAKNSPSRWCRPSDRWSTRHRSKWDGRSN